MTPMLHKNHGVIRKIISKARMEKAYTDDDRRV